MAAIPKLLGTKHLLGDDLAKAASEALGNAQRLIQAGWFAEAHRVLVAMLSPGPWRVSKKFVELYALWQNLYWLDQYAGLAAPPSDPADETARMAREWLPAFRKPVDDAFVAKWFNETDRTWTSAELAAAAAGAKRDDYGDRLRNVINGAEPAFRVRIRARQPFAAGGPSRPPGDHGDHGVIADLIERAAAVSFPRDYIGSVLDSGLRAAVIDALDGDTAAATARLGRLLPKAKPEADLYYRPYPAYAALLASRALAPALGIDDAGVAAYLAAFASRTPYTIAPAKPRPWKVVLKEFAQRLAEDGVDAVQLAGTLDAGLPDSKPLRARAKKGNALNTPCRPEAIAALEARLGVGLPPSYREFLEAADGLVVPDFVALLPASQVDWLRTLEPDTIAAWNETGDDPEASDEEYATYGADQDCIHMRPRHLHSALQVSSSVEGDVLLLVPDVRFGEEWEAWFLGAKNPGAYRFKSFRALMEQSVLAEDAR